jgi:excisionase family DNA binding protein
MSYYRWWILTTVRETRMPEVLTYRIEEVARLLGISRNSAYEAARRGEIPTIRIGKRLLVPRAAVNRLLEEPHRKAT